MRRLPPLLWFVVALSHVMGPSVEALTAVFLPTSCGTVNTVTTSVQLESGTGMFYSNSLNCNITFAVASPQLVLASIGRFELEPQRSGVCVDYINLHDGGDVSSSTLNSAALCGNSVTNTTYVTTGQEMTLYFTTDSTAVYLGFNIIFTAATVAPCGSEQMLCNNSYCIPSELACDNYDQCGDESDEDNCATVVASATTNWMPLIVGLTVGLLAVLLIAAYVAYRRYRHNRWKRFQNDHIHQDDIPDPDPSYPVTHKYFRGIRGHPSVQSYEATKGKKASFYEAGKPAQT